MTSTNRQSTQLQTFGIPFPPLNFRHSFMPGRRLDRQPWNGAIWDEAAVHGFDRERHVSAKADVQLFSGLRTSPYFGLNPKRTPSPSRLRRPSASSLMGFGKMSIRVALEVAGLAT